MRRITKAIGIVAGVAAVVWMVRDRLVTLTVAREPEPPAFRTPTMPAEPDDLTAVKGVGPTYAERLSLAGIRTYSDLAAAAPGRVAEIAQVSESRAQGWVSQASELR